MFCMSEFRIFTNEQEHDKNNKLHVRPVKTKISQGIRLVSPTSLTFKMYRLMILKIYIVHLGRFFFITNIQMKQEKTWCFMNRTTAQSDQSLRCSYEESLGC